MVDLSLGYVRGVEFYCMIRAVRRLDSPKRQTYRQGSRETMSIGILLLRTARHDLRAEAPLRLVP